MPTHSMAHLNQITLIENCCVQFIEIDYAGDIHRKTIFEESRRTK